MGFSQGQTSGVLGFLGSPLGVQMALGQKDRVTKKIYWLKEK